VIESPIRSTRGSLVSFVSGIQMLHHSMASREMWGSAACITAVGPMTVANTKQ
jgi:hypothetical protein